MTEGVEKTQCSICYDFNTFETSKLIKQTGGIDYNNIITQIIENTLEDKNILQNID
jgi:hypothetical protein